MNDAGALPTPGVPVHAPPPLDPASPPARGAAAGRGERLRRLLGAMGVFGVVGTWLVAVTDDLDLAVFLVVVMALSAAPFLVSVTWVRTRIASVLVGAGLVMVSFGVPAGFAARSSVVLGLLAALPLAWVVVGLGVAYDRLVAGRRSPGAGG